MDARGWRLPELNTQHSNLAPLAELLFEVSAAKSFVHHACSAHLDAGFLPVTRKSLHLKSQNLILFSVLCSF
jgi:hypothetical protein